MSQLAAVLVLALATARSAPACAQAPAFVRAAPVAVGSGSGEIFLLDLDRDGHLDILTKHLLSRRISVRLGDGRGGFVGSAETDTRFVFQPGTIAVGDVDGDGIADLGVTSRDSIAEYVHIYRGAGAGAFTPATGSPYRTNAAVRTYKPWLRFADADGDGDLDVITADGRRNTIEVLLGDGRGRFAAARSMTIGPAQDRYWFDAGDVDGDGRIDVVAVGGAPDDNGSARVMVLRGTGNGAFDAASGAAASLRGTPRAVTVAHVNDDRRLDIVVAHGSGKLSVLLNSGDGTFTPAAASPHDAGADAFAIAVGDVDRDDRPDLVAATVNSVTVFVAGPDGFVPAYGSPFGAGPGAYQVALADLNADGRLDIVASSFEGEALTVLLAR